MPIKITCECYLRPAVLFKITCECYLRPAEYHETLPFKPREPLYGGDFDENSCLN